MATNAQLRRAAIKFIKKRYSSENPCPYDRTHFAALFTALDSWATTNGPNLISTLNAVDQPDGESINAQEAATMLGCLLDVLYG